MLLPMLRTVNNNQNQVSHDHRSFERNLSNCEQKPEKVRTSTGFEDMKHFIYHFTIIKIFTNEWLIVRALVIPLTMHDFNRCHGSTIMMTVKQPSNHVLIFVIDVNNKWGKQLSKYLKFYRCKSRSSKEMTKFADYPGDFRLKSGDR